MAEGWPRGRGRLVPWQGYFQFSLLLRALSEVFGGGRNALLHTWLRFRTLIGQQIEKRDLVDKIRFGTTNTCFRHFLPNIGANTAYARLFTDT